MLKYNTFSITARCARTAELGVAVSTKVPAVGMLCPFVQSNVGAVATQSWVNPYLGIWGLEELASGSNAEQTLEYLKTKDRGIDGRQLSIVDSSGGSVAFTGPECDTWCGDLSGPNYAVAGNMLVGAETLQAMQEDFNSDQGSRPLAERLISALAAGQAAGGDKRGRQSAAVKVYSTEQYPALDLRVDEHPDPVAELRRIYEVARTELVPLLEMLPTLSEPEGNFDSDRQRQLGLLQD